MGTLRFDLQSYRRALVAGPGMPQGRFGCDRVNPAFALVLTGPAAIAFIAQWGDRLGAGLATDREVAVLQQGMFWELALGYQAKDVLLGPVRQRVDLDPAIRGFDRLKRGPAVTLVTFSSRDPGAIGRDRLNQGTTLRR